MAKRYEIWNKTDIIITPIGEVCSPEQWIDRYPAAEYIPYVVATGDIKGAFCASLAQMVSVFSQRGVDFSVCETDEDKLLAIEAWEDEEAAALAAVDTTESTPEERIAAALEYANVLAMPAVTSEDPDTL